MDAIADGDMATDRDAHPFAVYQRLAESMAMAVASVDVG